MSSVVQIQPPSTSLDTLPLYQQRGVYAMWALIATEFMLFVCMFGSYYYLGSNKDRWAHEKPPELILPFLLLAILLSSSVVLHWGERRVKAGAETAGRILLWITVLIGFAFLTVQGFEYATHWKDLTPYSDSYGSIFYTITGLHAAHVIVGLLMLMYVGILPWEGRSRRSPHIPYETVALYWHFVDAVWILIVICLYVIPHFQGHSYVH